MYEIAHARYISNLKRILGNDVIVRMRNGHISTMFSNEHVSFDYTRNNIEPCYLPSPNGPPYPKHMRVFGVQELNTALHVSISNNSFDEGIEVFKCIGELWIIIRHESFYLYCVIPRFDLFALFPEKSKISRPYISMSIEKDRAVFSAHTSNGNHKMRVILSPVMTTKLREKI